ncbi:hypothetical protein [Clostridium oceanicum]
MDTKIKGIKIGEKIILIGDILDSIELCIKNKSQLSTLILIYSTMDSMAYLSKSSTKNTVARKDFIEWTEKYLVKYLDSNCKGIDLYAARCGVLHSFIESSSLSNENQAKLIKYSWGTADNSLLKKVTDSRYISLNIESFLQALRRAVGDFLKDVIENNDMTINFENNSKDYFKNINLRNVN